MPRDAIPRSIPRPTRTGMRAALSGAVLLASMAICTDRGLAQSTEPPALTASRSLIGGYLAGRFAKSNHDIEEAAGYYGSALLHDPDNDVLIEQGFLLEVSSGRFDRARALAEKLVAQHNKHRLGNLFLGLATFKAGDLAAADAHLAAAGNGPIGELTSALMRAWIRKSQDKISEALDLLDQPKQAEWAQFYLRYHRGLIADAAGRSSDARVAYQRVFKQDSRTLRTTIAYARHAAHAGDRKLAETVLREYDRRATTDPHPLSETLREDIEAGKSIDLLITEPTEGIAEVLYGLGEALSTEGGVSVGIIYLQMALFLSPRQPLALAALAQAYETTKNYDEAIATYDLIPKGSPLQDAIDIRKAFDLNALDKTDAAKTLLEDVARRAPSDLAPLDALGNIMRSRKRYEEAITYYSKAINLIGTPDKRHWTFYYARGTCYERTKQWPKAEADLKKALSLSPDQPLVLNYLGYSWIDQGKNLRQGLQYIKKAVSLKPDDGYIVDSLGWAYYRLGRYKEAVAQLERAVELRPDDPVLNDHLGDALWRVGREREARFQWDQALSLKPEPEEGEKIRKKLAEGLASLSNSKPPRRARAASSEQRRKTKRVEAPAESLQ